MLILFKGMVYIILNVKYSNGDGVERKCRILNWLDYIINILL